MPEEIAGWPDCWIGIANHAGVGKHEKIGTQSPGTQTEHRPGLVLEIGPGQLRGVAAIIAIAADQLCACLQRPSQAPAGLQTGEAVDLRRPFPTDTARLRQVAHEFQLATIATAGPQGSEALQAEAFLVRPQRQGCAQDEQQRREPAAAQQGLRAWHPFRIQSEITPATSCAMAFLAIEVVSRPALVLASGSAPASSKR